MSLRATAAAAHYDPGMLSKVLNGRRPPNPYLAAQLDDALGAGGEIRAAAAAAPRPAKPARPASPVPQSAAVLAIRALMAGDPPGLDVADDSLAELVRHYLHAIAIARSAGAYGELVSARAFAGALLGQAPPRGQPDLTVTAGWLSSLLAVTATDLGDHAAAVVWCADTERRGQDAGYPELLGWAALTRAVIVYYQEDPARSADIAWRGQAAAPMGSAAVVKLAAQEMRCRAMLGDFAGMADARNRAAEALAAIRPDASTRGVYSIPADEDPPYTATSLLRADRYAEAAGMTRRIIDGAHRPPARPGTGRATSYARMLLILALAAAGLADADEAAAHGAAALEAGRVTWPTMVLASKLATSLDRAAPGSAHAAGLREQYLAARARLALPAPRETT